VAAEAAAISVAAVGECTLVAGECILAVGECILGECTLAVLGVSAEFDSVDGASIRAAAALPIAVRIARIRLSDKNSRLHPRHVVPKSAQAYEREVFMAEVVMSDRSAGHMAGGGRTMSTACAIPSSRFSVPVISPGASIPGVRSRRDMGCMRQEPPPRSALDMFYTSLTDEQKARLNAANEKESQNGGSLASSSIR
jgi:hypothetical protein